MVGTAIIIVLIGLICLYSATAVGDKSLLRSGFGKQVMWFFLSLLILASVLLTPVRVLFRGAYLFYGISMVLLVVVLIVASGSVHRWIDLKIFRFQPSELAKVATLLALARYLSQDKEHDLRWKRLLVGFVLVLLPIILIIREPDLGTATVFFALLCGLIFWAGIKWKRILFVVAPFLAVLSGFHVVAFIVFMIVVFLLLIITRPAWCVRLLLMGSCFGLGLASPALWSKLEPYQQQRIVIFLGMKSDPHGAAYQVIQSKVAIGSGGIIGKGFLNGSQTQLRFLPEQHTDFIFSVLAEEFGFIGVAVVFSLFFYLLTRIVRAAKTSRNRFSSFVAAGCFSILAFQFFVNVGMTTGLVPVTGLPVPFLSYGGSSLVLVMILVGLSANISRHRFEY